MRSKAVIYAMFLVLLFSITSSCTGLFPHPAPINVYWKACLVEDHPEISYSVYPIEYLYNEKEGILYIKGRWDLIAAIDIQNKKVLWRKFNTFNSSYDATLHEYKDMIFTLIYDEHIISTWGNSQPYIMGLDKKTGEVKWKYILESSEVLFCGFTIRDGYIYTRDNDPEATSLSTKGILKKIDIETKEVVWEIRKLSPLKTPIVDEENNIVFVGGGMTVYAFEDKGEEVEVKWKKILEAKKKDVVDAIMVPLVVHGDSVYVVTESGEFYRLKKDTGEIVWHTDFREECPKYKEESAIHFMATSPNVIYDNKYLITVEIGVIGIVAIDINTGKVVWVHPGYGALWGIYLDEKEGKIYAHGWSDVLECIDAETGKLIWRYDYGNGESRVSGAPYKVGKYIIDGDTSNYLYVLEEYE